MTKRSSISYRIPAVMLTCALCLLPFPLTACSSGSSGSSPTVSQEDPVTTDVQDKNTGKLGEVQEEDAGRTDGPAYSLPTSFVLPIYDASTAYTNNDASIDVSNVNNGWVGASAINASRLKFQVILGDMTYNYDLPNNGDPIICPINMGNGAYTFRVMQNTSGSNYVEICTVTADVTLKDPFAPFLIPTVFCEYNERSNVVEQARKLAKDAKNEGDVIAAVYDWVIHNISYDTAKAQELANATGYIPDPDETLAEKEGICFDYSALVAAMLRSLGIPCKIITGYVAPNDLYHAWNMVYIDGTWETIEMNIRSKTWERVDTTFGASGATQDFVGDGSNYTERYTY